MISSAFALDAHRCVAAPLYRQQLRLFNTAASQNDLDSDSTRGHDKCICAIFLRGNVNRKSIFVNDRYRFDVLSTFDIRHGNSDEIVF